jgi:sec-independent protein translocase protein TatA
MVLLFLNSLGTWEVVLIMAVVLMLFGSKGLPGIAKNLGKGMREIRTASNEIKRDIQNSALDMRKDMGVENPLDDLPKLNKIFDEDTESTVQLDSNKVSVEEAEGTVKVDDIAQTNDSASEQVEDESTNKAEEEA